VRYHAGLRLQERTQQTQHEAGENEARSSRPAPATSAPPLNHYRGALRHDWRGASPQPHRACPRPDGPSRQRDVSIGDSSVPSPRPPALRLNGPPTP